MALTIKIIMLITMVMMTMTMNDQGDDNADENGDDDDDNEGGHDNDGDVFNDHDDHDDDCTYDDKDVKFLTRTNSYSRTVGLVSQNNSPQMWTLRPLAKQLVFYYFEQEIP